MTLWAQTTTLYKVGMIGIVISFALFVVGFGTPAWYQNGSMGAPFFEQGLWQWCFGDMSMGNCYYFTFAQNTFFTVVRIIEIVACLFHLSTVIQVACRHNCCSEKSVTPIVVTGSLAGIVGLVGEAIYGTLGIAGQVLSNEYGGLRSHLSWSFALAVIGSSLVIIFSVLVAVGNRATFTEGHVVVAAPAMYDMNVHNVAPYQPQYMPYNQQPPQPQPYPGVGLTQPAGVQEFPMYQPPQYPDRNENGKQDKY